MTDNTESSCVHDAMPTVIAPWAYFMELEDRTGTTTSTPESVLAWGLQDDSHEVTITKHGISLGFRGVTAAVVPPASGETESPAVAVDGQPADDLTEFEDVLLDYCATCVRDHDLGRMEALTTPHSRQEREGGRITAYYECINGHLWTCHWAMSVPGEG